MDVAVDAALGERAEQADEDDRGEAGAGREALAVAEPEDQQGHDHGAAADPEEAAEDAGQGADRGQLQIAWSGVAGGGHRAILDAVSRETGDGAAATGRRAAGAAARRARAARRSSPTSTAPWRRSSSGPSEAAVPAAAREALARAERALRPGRLRLRAAGARRRGGWSASTRSPTPATTASSCCCRASEAPRLDPSLRRPRAGGGGVPRRARRPSSTAPGLRLEDKGPIQALHWRGAEDERGRRGAGPRDRRRGRAGRPRTALGPQGARAAPGRRRRQGRRGRRRCSPTDGIDRAAYAGDDRTDLDAFRRLRELREEGELETRGLRRRRSRRRRRRSSPRSRDLTVDGPGRLAGDPRVAGGVGDALHRPAARHRLPHRRRGDRARRDHRDRAPAATTDTTDDPRRRRLVAGRARDRPLPRPARARRRRRPRRPRPRPHRDLAAGPRRPARIALARLWPIGVTAIAAGVLGVFFPGVAAIGAGYALLVSPRLAHPRGRGARRRAARRRQVLRRPQLGPAPDRAGPHARACAATDSSEPSAQESLELAPAAGVGDVVGVSQARRAVATA